jgi:hypothetical protein
MPASGSQLLTIRGRLLNLRPPRFLLQCWRKAKSLRDQFPFYSQSLLGSLVAGYVNLVSRIPSSVSTMHISEKTDGRLRLKCNGTRTETRFRLSAKRMSPLTLTGASVQSTTGSRGARISGNNAGYTMFRGSVKGTGYPLHSPVSPSLPLPCVTVCHHVSAGLLTETLT